jgi:hypothetical protein
MTRTSTLAPRSPAAIWERVLLPAREDLTEEQARYFVHLKFPARDIRRMNSLSAKAREGRLTPAEDEELENYIRIGHLLGVLQSRARQVLRRTGRGS